MRKYIVLLLLSLSTLSFGQTLSNYKYVIVPNTFSFQKKPHQYNLNNLTKFLLNKYNFEAFIEGDGEEKIPEIDATKLLRLKVTEKGRLMSKIKLVFLDYKGAQVYTSKEGRSNRKDFKASYTEALRNAFKDKVITSHVYNKTPEVKTEQVVVATKKVALPKSKSFFKTEVFQLTFHLRGKQYSFVPASKLVYKILHDATVVGKATLQKNGVDYKLEAGTLTGMGKFDDYGNFILTRVNPANNKSLTDTMIRVK